MPGGPQPRPGKEPPLLHPPYGGVGALRDRGSPPTAPPAPSQPGPAHGAPTHPLLSSPGTPMSPGPAAFPHVGRGPRSTEAGALEALWSQTLAAAVQPGMSVGDLRLGTPTGSSSWAWPGQGPGKSPSPPWPVYSSASRGQAGASTNGSGKADCQGCSRAQSLCAGRLGPQDSVGPLVGRPEGGASSFEEGSCVMAWGWAGGVLLAGGLGSALAGGLLGDLKLGVVWFGPGALPQGEAAGLVEHCGTAWGRQEGLHSFPFTWGWGP